MNDPREQRAVDQAIKRDANVTPTSFRQALDSTTRNFVQTVDARQAAQATVSEPKPIAPIAVSETVLNSEPLAIMPTTSQMQAFPNGAAGDTQGYPAKQIIIVDNGTANYYTIGAQFVSAV